MTSQLPSSLFLCLALLVSVVVACVELMVKEFGNTIEDNKKGKDIRDLVIHYKDKVSRIMDVEIEKFNCIELFRDGRASAKESCIEFSKLTKLWEDVRSKCILIYMYDMRKPSDNQKYVESLDQISTCASQSLPQMVAVESKKNVRMVSGVEDLTDSSLIVSPTIALVEPVAHKPVTRSVANFPVKPTPSSQCRPYESPPQLKSTSLKKSCKYPAKPTSTSSPKPTANVSPPIELKVKDKSSYYLLISPSPSLQSKADYTLLQSTLTSYLSKSQIRSSLKKPDSTPLESTPNPSKPHSNPKHSSRALSKPNCNLAPTKPHTRSQSRDDGIHTGPSFGPKKSSSSSTSKYLPPFNPLPLAVLRVDVLLDFDVGSLFREPQLELEENEWDDGRDAVISIVGAQAEGGRVIVTSVDNNPPSADDSEDEDFIVDGEDVDNSEDMSLDEKNNSSESEDDKQLKVQSEQLPHNVLGSGTTRCKTWKHLGHNAAIYWRPRDEHGWLLTKRKRRPTECRVPKLQDGPKKQKAATLTPTPSTTVTAQAGLSIQCSQVRASQAT
ncbi:hypothetical protein Cgig2_021043 [Carnegiea gigantea]|uniref:Uncharacterized protein n=1 Tax=Carnegiea gigantea TaxID=171969 RepID=A0A9Q1JPY1_9CARY|nr:hypothetical protein Cgig2_021043 [Carnegiea gigantea]